MTATSILFRPVVERTEHATRDMLAVLGFALGLRLLFAALTSGTYDYDEFVILLLSRDFAHGAVPYQSFMFFHPPGVLVIFRLLEPLTGIWWPAARLTMLVLDGLTALMVWRVGTLIYGSTGGLAAGLFYAANPVALVSAVRVGQDAPITALGVAGLLVLLSTRSHRGAALAGACLAIAVWIKYPALLFLPVYAAASPRRFLTCCTSSLAVGLALFLPFLHVMHALYQDTVTFQKTRWLMPLDQRLETTILYWWLACPLALIGLFRRRDPAWLIIGFALGGLFLFGSQVYYHYYAPIAPFAALLAASLASPGRRLFNPVLATAGIALATLWGLVIAQGGPSPLFVTAAHFNDIRPTVRILDSSTGHNDLVLADRFEYAYLANRKALAHYFWNVGVLVDAAYLERRLPAARAVVLSYGASSGYPTGFTNYLDSRYRALRTPAATVWLLAPHPKGS